MRLAEMRTGRHKNAGWLLGQCGFAIASTNHAPEVALAALSVGVGEPLIVFGRRGLRAEDGLTLVQRGVEYTLAMLG